MNCLFCSIIAGNIPCEKVFENEHAIAFLDIHPNNPGHTLVVPKKHFENLLETDDDVARELMSIVKKIAPQIITAVGAEGFNTGINTGATSGQVIMHTHVHIIPRFKDDGLVHWPSKEMSAEDLKKIGESIKKMIV